jgi:hypothetical protein
LPGEPTRHAQSYRFARLGRLLKRLHTVLPHKNSSAVDVEEYTKARYVVNHAFDRNEVVGVFAWQSFALSAVRPIPRPGDTAIDIFVRRLRRMTRKSCGYSMRAFLLEVAPHQLSPHGVRIRNPVLYPSEQRQAGGGWRGTRRAGRAPRRTAPAIGTYASSRR